MHSGEVGIDDALVLQSKEEVIEMNNGCICCTGELPISTHGKKHLSFGKAHRHT